ncbi:unnamed protein product [Ceutorhynchus assimilis]|uniref:G-protein coupled receptors family 2 profile 2 domain-containing protein n=1 Tax=Ceutorhynchus assimilis TaxID=467358 RepID=A0A9P0GJE8_9CUCU|nr:unnamed protein product [Ceutorhynchus assimilis]
MNGIVLILLISFGLFSKSQSVENCDETIDITNGIKEGTSYVFRNFTFTENDYFTNSSGVFGCLCHFENCVQACCPRGQTLKASSNRLECVQETSQSYVQIKGVQLTHIIQVPDRRNCSDDKSLIMLNATQLDLELLKYGFLKWEESVFHYKDYCIFSEGGDVVVMACVDPEMTVSFVLYCIGMIISMPFLLATFLVYAILPDRNLHQRALMFYVLTLLISYMLLVTINLSENINRPWCEIFGYLTLYFFMVSFFWMNVICFDIWYTFSGGRGFVGSKRTSERKRLLLYSLYAFGVPLLVALLVLLLQSKVLSESSEHNPGIGINKCFLGDGWPNLWYFYLEAGLLVLMNIIFFTLTALKIRQVKKETSMLKHNDSQRHSYEKDKQKFNLYVKLLFAMGVNWSMEVISWLVNWRTGNNIQYIWWATDFFNAVYGVFIFFMFVFKKKIWKLLQRRYYTFVGKPHLAHTMTTTNATRTSHYSSTNYSTTDTAVTDRTNVSNGNGRGRPEEMALRTVT